MINKRPPRVRLLAVADAKGARNVGGEGETRGVGALRGDRPPEAPGRAAGRKNALVGGVVKIIEAIGGEGRVGAVEGLGNDLRHVAGGQVVAKEVNVDDRLPRGGRRPRCVPRGVGGENVKRRGNVRPRALGELIARVGLRDGDSCGGALRVYNRLGGGELRRAGHWDAARQRVERPAVVARGGAVAAGGEGEARGVRCVALVRSSEELSAARRLGVDGGGRWVRWKDRNNSWNIRQSTHCGHRRAAGGGAAAGPSAPELVAWGVGLGGNGALGAAVRRAVAAAAGRSRADNRGALGRVAARGGERALAVGVGAARPAGAVPAKEV